VERGAGGVNHRGALLGPEESGPANRNLVSGGWDCSSGSRITPIFADRVCLVAGAGSHQTVGVGVLDWVGCFPGLDARVPGGGGSGLVFLPVF
jgi:hypothetical protein